MCTSKRRNKVISGFSWRKFLQWKVLFYSSSCLFLSFISCFFAPWKRGEGAFGNILQSHEYKQKPTKSTCILTIEYYMPPHPKLHLFLEVGVGLHRSNGVGNTYFLASLKRERWYHLSYFSFFIIFISHYTYYVIDAEPTKKRLCQYKSHKGEQFFKS